MCLNKNCGAPFYLEFETECLVCHRCGLRLTPEFLQDCNKMIVRAAFNQLIQPGLAKSFAAAYGAGGGGGSGGNGVCFLQKELQEDEMAILHPDTSKIPIWRLKPTRMEHPITAWRCWGLREDSSNHWTLTSITADCVWEGPVMRAHKRPVDPKYWDEMKQKGSAIEYSVAFHDTFKVAGIYATKDEKYTKEIADDCGVSCYGTVKLFGRVAQYTDGYRAEVCMINELWILPSIRWMFNFNDDERYEQHVKDRTADVVRDLEKRYGCEVHLL